MTRDDTIKLAMKAGLLDKVDCSDDYFIPGDAFVEEIEAFAKLVAEAERNECERLKHAMREAMHLLDQPEPRPHAAFSELLLALNPGLPSAIRARGESK
jgi:hypothetical protein